MLSEINRNLFFSLKGIEYKESIGLTSTALYF